MSFSFFFFFQAEDGIRDDLVTGVQTCALPIWRRRPPSPPPRPPPPPPPSPPGRAPPPWRASRGRSGVACGAHRPCPPRPVRRTRTRRRGRPSGPSGPPRATAAPSCGLPLRRDVDPVLEHARIEALDLRRPLDVRGGLAHRLEVGPLEHDLVPLDGDLRSPEDRGLPRAPLPQEVLDHELRSLHARLHREVGVDDLHPVPPPRPHPLDHVPDVRRVRAGDRLVLPLGELARDPDLAALHRQPDAGVPHLSLEGVLPGADADRGRLDRDRDPVRDLDPFIQQSRDRHRQPQYTYASSFPPTPSSFALWWPTTPAVVVRMSTPKSCAGR